MRLTSASNKVANPAQGERWPSHHPVHLPLSVILIDEEFLGETNPLFTIRLRSIRSYLRVNETG